VIGYYAHHHGSGHVHRAMAIAAEIGDEVTILSSAARPAEWDGGWIQLPLDTGGPELDPRARGSLHWAPLDSAGLSTRMSMISAWLESTAPETFVVDVSVEVALLVRLHGIRVVVIAQPGDRADAVHTLGYSIVDAIVGCWPPAASPFLASEDAMARVEAVGGLGRFPVSPGVPNARQIAVITGRGGRGQSTLSTVVAEARLALPDYDWIELQDATPALVAATLRKSLLVFAHCGANVIAEIAAVRTPAVLVAEPRPFGEQEWVARELARLDVPALVVSPGDMTRWPSVIGRLASYRRDAWNLWVDGHAAERAAAIIERVAGFESEAA
jgi:hypothetical protein